ncbi:hypothetical protein IJG27_04655 [Candidatus Saccharibacteria bacterium]|nr:hypothetical protein [Candidatus Saccharibacteria bacterium]
MNYDDVETARKTYLKKSQKCLLVSAVVAVVLGLASSVGSRAVVLFGIIFTLVIFAFGAGITIFLTRKEATAYKKAYKAYSVEQNLHHDL